MLIFGKIAGCSCYDNSSIKENKTNLSIHLLVFLKNNKNQIVLQNKKKEKFLSINRIKFNYVYESIVLSKHGYDWVYSKIVVREATRLSKKRN